MELQLDDFLHEVDDKYQAVTFGFEDKKVTFRNMLRLPADTRGQVRAAINEMADLDTSAPGAEEKSVDLMKRVLRLAADHKEACDQLLQRFCDDTAALQHLLTTWVNTAQVGEA